jgi:hypothetical protein
MPGAHLNPHQQGRDPAWLLLSGTMVAVAGALLAVRRGLLPQTAGVVLLLLGCGVASWGVVRLVREQPPPPRPTTAAVQGPTTAAVQGPSGRAGLVRPARRDRLGRPGLEWAGRPRHAAQRRLWPGRWDHGLASRAAAAVAGWRGRWSRRRLPVIQRRPARHARTRSRGGGQ